MEQGKKQQQSNNNLKKNNPGIYVLAYLRQRKMTFWSLKHKNLLSPEKGLPQLRVFPLLYFIFQCVIFGLCSLNTIFVIFFFSLYCLESCAHTIIILSKEWIEVSNKLKDLERLWKHPDIKLCKLKACTRYIRDNHIAHTPNQHPILRASVSQDSFWA